jgi:hypothetical protein
MSDMSNMGLDIDPSSWYTIPITTEYNGLITKWLTREPNGPLVRLIDKRQKRDRKIN